MKKGSLHRSATACRHGTAARLAMSLVAAATLASGCATSPSSTAPGAAPAVAVNPDPWESLNRKTFAFNETLDAYVLRPVAEGYRKVVPKLVRTGVDNVLGNIYDVWSTANQFMQFKLQYGTEMGMRVATNTFFGLGGILDPATEFGLVRRSEDFGQTLGRWGLASGPFLVLPLFGPSTVRDTGGFAVDRFAWPNSPSALPASDAVGYAVSAVEVVNTRANLLETGNLVDQVSLDKYSFIRDAYLARRRDAVHDGAAPAEAEAFDYGSSGDATPPGAGPAVLAPNAAASAPAGAASAPPRAVPPATGASAPRR